MATIPEAIIETLAIHQSGRLFEAECNYRQILSVAPDAYVAHNNLGAVLVDQGRIAEALECFDRCLEIDPDYLEARMNRAINRLLLGDYAAGLPDYELRFRFPAFPPRTFPHTLWDGSPLMGRTVLLHAEQGLGDTIAFIRFAPLVQQRGGSVQFECPLPLVELLKSQPGVDEMIPLGSDLLPFDVHASLMSLPNVLGITLDTLPASTAYIDVDAARVEHWRSELAGQRGFRIGINWQGNPDNPTDLNRSVPLACFEPLGQLHGVRLVSLQRGSGVEQLAEIGDRFDVLAHATDADDARSFVDTAAIMRNLDLVVTSDTSIANLAGALGVPVWIALGVTPDWRWLLDRDDSRFPTAKLFRQSERGRWDDVFARIAAEVAKRLPTEQ